VPDRGAQPGERGRGVGFVVGELHLLEYAPPVPVMTVVVSVEEKACREYVRWGSGRRA
jgi:hypothetical protein